jgi:hypothetical protein
MSRFTGVHPRGMRKYGPGFTTSGAAERLPKEKEAASKASLKSDLKAARTAEKAGPKNVMEQHKMLRRAAVGNRAAGRQLGKMTSEK